MISSTLKKEKCYSYSSNRYISNMYRNQIKDTIGHHEPKKYTNSNIKTEYKRKTFFISQMSNPNLGMNKFKI